MVGPSSPTRSGPKRRHWQRPPEVGTGRFTMRILTCSRGTYLAELTDAERCALAWWAEAGRALLLGDPDVALLARETAISAAHLDRLADALCLAGSRPADRGPRAPTGGRRRPSARG